MNQRLIVRLLSAACLGVAAPWLWAWALLGWGLAVEGHLFHVIYAASGIKGPVALHISNGLFAFVTALLASGIFVLFFKRTWALLTSVFLVAFFVGAVLQSVWAGSSVSFLLTYDALWLFVGFFAAVNGAIGRGSYALA